MACISCVRWLRKLLLHDDEGKQQVYSLERFCAFHEYSLSRSSRHIWCVCFMTMVPPFSLIVLLDSLPLRDPSEGWAANWALWIRSSLSTFSLSLGVVLMLFVTAPAVALTIRKCVLISMASTVAYTSAMLALIVCFDCFPVPFMFVTTAGVWESFFIVFVVLAVGRRKLSENKEAKIEVKRFAAIMVALFPLIIIYPGYNAVFVRLTGTAESLFVLGLPIAKFFLKKLLAKASVGLEDYIPTIVASIDLFNAIYQSKCMQSAGSLMTTLGVMILDVCESLFHLYLLREDVKEIMELQELRGMPPTEMDLIAAALEICERPELLDKKFVLDMQLKSCAPSVGNALSKNKAAILARMTRQQIEVIRSMKKASRNVVIPAPGSISDLLSQPQSQKVSEQSQDESKGKQTPLSLAQFALFQSRVETHTATTPFSPSILCSPVFNDKTRTFFVQKTLKLLRKTEILLMVEYIECAIPLLYAAYLPIIYMLPTGQYYPEIKALNLDSLRSTVLKVVLYAFMEFLSLIWVHWILKRRFRLSAMHQLAYALEEEKLVVQSSLLSWTIVIFQFTLAHFGTYTFVWGFHGQYSVDIYP